jgi:hypothetical protein
VKQRLGESAGYKNVSGIKFITRNMQKEKLKRKSLALKETNKLKREEISSNKGKAEVLTTKEQKR